MKFIIILSLVILVGCSTYEIVYINNGTNFTNCLNETPIETVKIIETTVECPVWDACPFCNTSKIERDLMFCNIWLDERNKELYKYMSNTTLAEDNLTECKRDKMLYKNRLDNISDYVRGFY